MDGQMNTLIGKDSIITGTIDVKGPLRIDGKVKGQVNSSDTVTVGAGGELEAELVCKVATVAGKVDGNIIASEKVELQAKAEISELKARLQATESRETVLQDQYGDLQRQLSLLRGQIQRPGASPADDRKSGLKIEKTTRFTGGKPEPLDMVVSINKFSITWQQIDAILDKLDEITHTLSRP